MLHTYGDAVRALIALCGDLGMTPAKGAAMLTVMLVCAFIARQLWGWLSDRSAG